MLHYLATVKLIMRRKEAIQEKVWSFRKGGNETLKVLILIEMKGITTTTDAGEIKISKGPPNRVLGGPYFASKLVS